MNSSATKSILLVLLFFWGLPRSFSQEPSQSQAPPAAQEQTPQENPNRTTQPSSAPAESPAPEQAAPGQTVPEQPTQSEPKQPPPTAGAPETNTQSATTEHKESSAPKPPVLRHKKHKTIVKKQHPTQSATSATNGDAPKKVIVRNGGEKDEAAQLAPAVMPGQAEQQSANTQQLLAATDANLNLVSGRQLSPTEQNTVDQIHTYMKQAKAASASGDTSRAHTLAYKARLLSDELARK